MRIGTNRAFWIHNNLRCAFLALYNTNIGETLQPEQPDFLNKSVTEMRTSSLFLVIIVFIILCTSNVQSKHRRRSGKKPKPTHDPKPSKPKPKPKHCQSLTHCVTDQWSVWSNCSVACGTNGTQIRTRKVSYVRGFLWLIVRHSNFMYERWC